MARHGALAAVHLAGRSGNSEGGGQAPTGGVLSHVISMPGRSDRRPVASPICDLLHRRLQPFRYLHDCSGCFRLQRSGRAGFAPTGKRRLVTAHTSSGHCRLRCRPRGSETITNLRVGERSETTTTASTDSLKVRRATGGAIIGQTEAVIQRQLPIFSWNIMKCAC